jgi:hypothetical protein
MEFRRTKFQREKTQRIAIIGGDWHRRGSKNRRSAKARAKKPGPLMCEMLIRGLRHCGARNEPQRP